MGKDDFSELISSCIKGERIAQKQLYYMYYSYGMNICYRYAKNMNEAEEMINDAFLRVFAQLDKFDINLAFKPWFHKIVLRASLNFIKKWDQGFETKEIENAQLAEVSENVISQINENEIHQLIKKLPRTYQSTFNLYVVEGYSHAEIGEILNISENTSRSNLLIARQKLQKMIVNLQFINV